MDSRNFIRFSGWLIRVLTAVSPAVLAMAGVAAALVVAGCGKRSDDQAVAPPPANQPGGQPQGSLTVWAWGPPADVLAGLADEFSRRQPGVSVNVVKMERRNAWAMLGSGLGSGGSGLPDVVVADEGFPAFVARYRQGFVDLTDRLAGYHQLWVSGFSGMLTADGRWLAAPWLVRPVAMYYRIDMLPPMVREDDLAQWPTILAQSDRWRSAGRGLLPVGYNSTDFLRILMQENDAGIYTASGEIAISGRQAVSAMEMLCSLEQSGLLVSISGQDDLLERLRTDRLTAVIAGSEFGGVLKSALPMQAGRWKVLPLPAYYPGGPNVAALPPLGLAITAASRQPGLAWEFIRYCTLDGGPEYALTRFSVLPALRATYGDDSLSEDDFFVGNRWGVFFWTAEHPVLTNYTADYIDSDRYLLPAMQAALRGDTAGWLALRRAAEDMANNSGRKIAGR
ncbi:MAG: extracellular solute-binding protein [Negativicutes bacterium]|nr:extracellular solute-binding protein [Negativicutes bacterium]